MKWVHLATAPDQLTAELWLAILRDGGIGAMINPADAVSYLGTTAFGCRIQVREDDLVQARELLDEEEVPGLG